jgi:hypothetical protein
LVIGVKQGMREVHAGETIPRDRALTLVIGGGEIDSTMFEDEFDGEGLDIDMDETDGEDFDIEL